ncbi:MAG: IS66 family transposase, partial [Methanoculleus sp.]|nr:IS66 family transposase [Methanoculleus sp.]NQS74548.1 IS66 family transposase [Methanoculleus sp.]
MTLERDEILALIQTDPEAIVTIIQTLEKRIADLERQLNMNSRNSSRPPSTDGFKRPQKKRKRT